MKGVILAAGQGTRMKPLTHRRPKPLVPVVNRPMIHHVILGACSAGVDDFLIVVGYRAEDIMAALGDGSALGVRLRYIMQEEQNGTGGATLLAEDFGAGEPFMLSWADIVTPAYNYPPVVADYQEHQPALTLTLNWMEDPYEGAAVYVQDGVVEKIEEKPPKGTAATHWNNAGVFVCHPIIFEALHIIPPSARGEYEFPAAVQLLMDQGEVVRGVALRDFRSDMARPSELFVVDPQMIAAQTGDPVGVMIGEEVALAPGAQLEGPAAIAARARIGNACLVPAVCLGEGVRVEDEAALAHVSVFAGAHIGEGADLEYVVVEEGTTVPAGASHHGTPSEPVILGAAGEES
jgi:NDP-sugar pyrophosphorylase family protein